MAEAKNNIEIKGAKENNLKNIDLDIPRGKFNVVTGLSGSGKSTLAFDTVLPKANAGIWKVFLLTHVSSWIKWTNLKSKRSKAYPLQSDRTKHIRYHTAFNRGNCHRDP